MYEYKTEPFAHQRDLFDLTKDKEAYAVFWEQGCGKTKPQIDIATYLFLGSNIDAVLVVAPGGVERNWMTDEVPTHMPANVLKKTKMMAWSSKSAKAKYHQRAFEELIKHPGLSVLCISYHAFVTELGKKAVWRFLRRRRCLYILDESDDIKTPGAKRTKSIVASGKYAPYRRILTGTPADKPFDMYSQMRFLDEKIWKNRQMENFYAFKQHFGVWYTRAEAQADLGYDPGYDRLIDFKNIPELTNIVADNSSRLLKTDVLDLPAKLYTKRYFSMTSKQQSLYDQLKRELLIELEDGRIVDGELAITNLLRLQQIACGYMVTDDEDEPIALCDKKNPRLDATLELLEKGHHQSIVWARFRHDIDQLMDALGDKACRYDGSLDEDACERSKNEFRAGDRQFFVANAQKGARGLTLNAAKTVVYYSNTFRLRDRLQSEDRCHRIGQDGAEHDGVGHGVLFVDMMAQGTVDEKIVKALRSKFNIAGQLTGDVLREWI